MLPMMRNQTMISWRSAEQWLPGSMALTAFKWFVLGAAQLGVATGNADRLLDAFFTTKSGAHGGRLSASGRTRPGATFQFALPWHREDST